MLSSSLCTLLASNCKSLLNGDVIIINEAVAYVTHVLNKASSARKRFDFEGR